MGWRWKGKIYGSGDTAGQEADEEMRVASEGFGSDGKKSACNAGDPGSIPGSGRSPGERNGYPLQYSCLVNPMNRGAWQAIVSMGLQRVGHD